MFCFVSPKIKKDVEKYEPSFTGQNNPEEEEERQDVQIKKPTLLYLRQIKPHMAIF